MRKKCKNSGYYSYRPFTLISWAHSFSLAHNIVPEAQSFRWCTIANVKHSINRSYCIFSNRLEHVEMNKYFCITEMRMKKFFDNLLYWYAFYFSFPLLLSHFSFCLRGNNLCTSKTEWRGRGKCASESAWKKSNKNSASKKFFFNWIKNK